MYVMYLWYIYVWINVRKCIIIDKSILFIFNVYLSIGNINIKRKSFKIPKPTRWLWKSDVTDASFVCYYNFTWNLRNTTLKFSWRLLKSSNKEIQQF